MLVGVTEEGVVRFYRLATDLFVKVYRSSIMTGS